MKRLTEPKGFVNGIACQERGVELYWRLKQYEDIGLDPEEIKNLLEHLEIEAGQLRQELVDERYRHDRLLDFEVAQAREFEYLKNDLLQTAINNIGPCELCANYEGTSEKCEDDCVLCSECKSTCPCAQCKAGSNWKWRGIPDETNPF